MADLKRRDSPGLVGHLPEPDKTIMAGYKVVECHESGLEQGPKLWDRISVETSRQRALGFGEAELRASDESIDVGTIGSKPPDVVASPTISQLRNVIAETPQDRENAANRWPLDAKAANKASFSAFE